MKNEVQYRHCADIPGLVLGMGQFTDYSFERHYHLDCHIGLVTQGVQRQHYGGHTEDVGPGCIALMPPGVIHDGMRKDGGAYTLKTFRIPHDLLNQLLNDLQPPSGTSELPALNLHDPFLARQLLILHTALQGKNCNPLATQTQWLELLQRLFGRAGGRAPTPATGMLPDLKWRNLRDYCMSRLSEKITLDELASLCGLERFRFLRQFKRATGMTPHAWLMRLRLEEACARLAKQTAPVARIAQDVGFFDQSHFNRAFRQAFGAPPSRY